MKGSDSKVCMKERVRIEGTLGQILIGFGNTGVSDWQNLKTANKAENIKTDQKRGRVKL